MVKLSEIMFLEFIIQHPWSQIVNFSTRYLSALDLVLTDVKQCVVQVGRQPPLGGSDHDAVEILFSLTSRNNTHACNTVIQNHKYLWHCADYDHMGKCLSAVDWMNVLCNNS